MTSTFDEEETFDTREEESASRDYDKEYRKVEDRLTFVFYQISDYLHEHGRTDLFTELTLTDVSAMIYNPNYINQLLPHVENKII